MSATSCQDIRRAQPARNCIYEGLLTLGPYLHATTPAIHTPHQIHEEHGKAPQRHKLEQAGLQRVVTRSRTPAARADRPAVASWKYLHQQCRLAPDSFPSHCSVDKGLELLHSIQNSLHLHPGLVSPALDLFGAIPNTGFEPGCATSLSFSSSVSPHPGLCGSVNRPHVFSGRFKSLWKSARLLPDSLSVATFHRPLICPFLPTDFAEDPIRLLRRICGQSKGLCAHK